MKRVAFDLCAAGFCTHPEVVTMKNASFKSCEFPSLFGLIQHPQEGFILFDTGYHPDYNIKKKWPESIYPLFIPATISESQTAAQQIKARGFHPDDVKWVIISHFHGDHVAGLNDFKKAKFLCRRAAFEQVHNKSPFRNLLNGFLPHLLPQDFLKRVEWIDDRRAWRSAKMHNLEFSAVDLFGDESLIAIDLPGHKNGQVGLFLQSEKAGSCLMIGDASWSLKAIKELRPPSKLAGLILDNSKDYLSTFLKLNQLLRTQPEITVLPSHCRESYRAFGEKI